MNIFIQILLNSLETGGIYALAALSIILIYKTSITQNFALATLSMFAAYTTTYIYLKTGWPVGIVTVIGLVCAFILGVLVDRIVISKALKVNPVSKQIITLGLIMVFLGVAPMVFGTDPLQFPRFLYGSHTILGATLSYNAMVNIASGIIIMVVLFFMLQKSKWGLSVRATASNDIVARMMGIPTPLITMGSWAIATALGTLSALMLAPTTSVNLSMNDGVMVIALLACVLGGFQTFYGPVVAAYLIGVASNLLSYYVSSTWSESILYLLILAVILFRPNGLFGKTEIKKV